MDIIYDKIYRDIEDSEIIQDIEHAKRTPGFDVNMGDGQLNWSLL